MTTLRRRQLHHYRISLELSAVLLFICNDAISVLVMILILLTYLLNPLRAEVHIRPTPQHATAVYHLMFSRVFPRSGYNLSFIALLLQVSFGLRLTRCSTDVHLRAV